MASSAIDIDHVRVVALAVTEERLVADLSDGRAISVPLSWYPRLTHGSTEERGEWRLLGGGRGIHWPRLDEDISVENLLFGKPSAEGQASLARWLATRTPRS